MLLPLRRLHRLQWQTCLLVSLLALGSALRCCTRRTITAAAGWQGCNSISVWLDGNGKNCCRWQRQVLLQVALP